MELSEHFDLNEFTRSATADRLHIDNNLNPSDPTGQSIINNLRNLCQQFLEPLREHFGIPVIISSGYRCPALNRAVGGVSNSQHLTGEAADIILPPLTLNTHHSTNGSTGLSTTFPSTNWVSNPKAPPNGFTSAARWTRARTANASSGRLYNWIFVQARTQTRCPRQISRLLPCRPV